MDRPTAVPAPAGPGRRVLAVLLAALALSWAGLVNGGPFLHPDSIGYVRGPDVAVMKLLGQRFATPWARFDPGAVDQRHAGRSAPTGPRTASYNDNEVMAGRSIYYGALAYLGALSGGFWLTVFVQALAVAWLCEIMLRALRVASLTAYAGVVALLALASPAPFFIAFLMPDIWAGVAIGALAVLFVLPERLRPLDVAALGAMCLFAALAHNSVPPVVLAMAGAGEKAWLLARRSAPPPVLGLAVSALALVGAAAGALAFGAMVRHASGQPPVNPPFLTARVIADGPGARFARERCGRAFAVCAYAERFPMSVDDFLWGDGPRGVFDTASSAQRRALGDEQARFAWAVARAYPAEQAQASARNIALQAFDTELSDFDYKATVASSLTSRTPPAYAEALEQTVAYHRGWPLKSLWALQAITAMAAIGVALGAASHARWFEAKTGAGAPAGALFAMILVGVAANAAVCGALSTLYGRYEARVVWLLPLAAAAMLLSTRPIAGGAHRAIAARPSPPGQAAAGSRGAPTGSPRGVSAQTS